MTDLTTDDDLGGWESPVPEHWEVTSDSAADWCLAKYARAEQEVTRLRELAQEEIARITQRVEQATASALRDMDFFGDHLTRYHQSLLDAGRATGTYKLLNGDLTVRNLPARVEIVDDEAFKDWAEAKAPELLRVKIDPDKRALLAHVKQTGEQVPGVELISGEVSFKPKPGKHEQPAFLPLPGEDVAA